MLTIVGAAGGTVGISGRSEVSGAGDDTSPAGDRAGGIPRGDERLDFRPCASAGEGRVDRLAAPSARFSRRGLLFRPGEPVSGIERRVGTGVRIGLGEAFGGDGLRGL